MRYLIQIGLTRYFNHKMIYKKTIFKHIEDSLVLVYRIFSFLLNIYLYSYKNKRKNLDKIRVLPLFVIYTSKILSTKDIFDAFGSIISHFLRIVNIGINHGIQSIS